MKRSSLLCSCLILVTIAASVLALVTTPADAQVKIRFQTWHWGEKPVDSQSRESSFFVPSYVMHLSS